MRGSADVRRGNAQMRSGTANAPSCIRAATAAHHRRCRDDVVDEAVLQRFLAVNQRSRSESAVMRSMLCPVCSALRLGHLVLRVDHLLGLDLDVGCRTTDAAERLVHNNTRVEGA